MLDQQINEQLGLLQKELSRLKTVTDYIDGAKENSISIIAELEKVQQNYAVYTDKIFNLYKQYVDDLKKNNKLSVSPDNKYFVPAILIDQSKLKN